MGLEQSKLLRSEPPAPPENESRTEAGDEAQRSGQEPQHELTLEEQRAYVQRLREEKASRSQQLTFRLELNQAK